jgi:hypothetical protein
MSFSRRALFNELRSVVTDKQDACGCRGLFYGTIHAFTWWDCIRVRKMEGTFSYKIFTCSLKIN